MRRFVSRATRFQMSLLHAMSLHMCVRSSAVPLCKMRVLSMCDLAYTTACLNNLAYTLHEACELGWQGREGGRGQDE
jgi:hypothetical protein